MNTLDLPPSPVAEDHYPSRTEPWPRRLPRLDPVVHGDGPGPLDPAQVDRYARDGFLVLEGLFAPDEVAALNAELDVLAESPAVRALEETVREPDSGLVRSIFRVHALSDVFDRLVRDPRLLDAARQLLGGGVYVHQARVNLKPGFHGREFYWHSDFETWHVEDGMPRMRALSVSLALTDNHVFNGPLMLIPGSHHTFVCCVGETPERHYRTSLRRQQYGVPDDESLRAMADAGRIVMPSGPAGGAVLFDCNTMHGSGSNISPYPRRNAFVVYNSVENRLRDPFCGLSPRPEHIACRRPAPLTTVDGR